MGVDGDAVVTVLVAPPDPSAGRHRSGLRDADEFQCEVAVGGLGVDAKFRRACRHGRMLSAQRRGSSYARTDVSFVDAQTGRPGTRPSSVAAAGVTSAMSSGPVPAVGRTTDRKSVV